MGERAVADKGILSAGDGCHWPGLGDPIGVHSRYQDVVSVAMAIFLGTGVGAGKGQEVGSGQGQITAAAHHLRE
jgi:hypothetical protein